MKPSFKELISVLQPVLSHSEDLVNAAVSVESLLDRFDYDARAYKEWSHEDLVQIARDSIAIHDYLKNSKKIQAIKWLRTLTDCGLRSAKEAIEDYRVQGVIKQDEAIEALRKKLDYNEYTKNNTPF